MVGLAAILPYASLLVSGELVLEDSPYSDYGSFQVPMREFAQSEFAAGRFPHWIPWVGCGVPLHATQQVGLCYPLLTPLLFLCDANRAIKLALFLHVVLCYVGQYRLARSLSLSPAAAALSGLIVTQGGFLTTHLAVGHVAFALVYGLLPWFFGSVVAVCRRASLSSAAQFAACLAGLLLIGHPQAPYYALLFGALWSVGSLCAGAASRHRVRVCGLFLLGLVGGVMIAAVQLAPTLELLRDNAGMTARGSVAYAGTYALEGADLFRLLVPSLRGSPLVGIPEFQPPDFYHEKVCYLGLLTWCLALAALVLRRPCAPGSGRPAATVVPPLRRRDVRSAERPDYGKVAPDLKLGEAPVSPAQAGFLGDRWPWGVAILVVVGLLIALGRTTVLFDTLGSVLPGLFLFRCPGRCLAVVSVLVALLAGRGFDALNDPRLPRSSIVPWSLLALLVLFDFVVLVDRSLDSLDWVRWSDYAQRHLSVELHAGAFFLACVMVFVWQCRRMSERHRCLLAALILAADLGYFNLRGIRYEADDWRPLPSTVLGGSEQARFVEAPRYPNFSRDEVRYSRFVPQAVRSRVRMIGTNEGGVLPAGCEVVYRALETNSVNALRLAGGRDVVRRANGTKWVRVAEPLPRIRFLPLANAGDMAGPLDMGGSLDAVGAADGLAALSTDRNAVLEVLTDDCQELLVQVGTPTGGMLIVADTFYPGWTCRVDETPADIIRVFGCFRGVRLSAGSRLVRMRYRSESFVAGSKLSAAGLLTLLAMIWIGRRRATPR